MNLKKISLLTYLLLILGVATSVRVFSLTVTPHEDLMVQTAVEFWIWFGLLIVFLIVLILIRKEVGLDSPKEKETTRCAGKSC